MKFILLQITKSLTYISVKQEISLLVTSIFLFLLEITNYNFKSQLNVSIYLICVIYYIQQLVLKLCDHIES